MKVCSLASSSKGNCTIVYNENEILIVDMGITLKDLEEKLNRLKLDINNVIGVIVSHEHSDHTKGLATLHKNFSTDIFVFEDALDGFVNKTKIPVSNLTVFNDTRFVVGSFEVECFRVSHDVTCVGFSIWESNNKISIVTDLGYTTNDIVERLYESRLVILESNHDEKMVMNGKYPPILKQRILGRRGHLSNLNSARVVGELACHGVAQVLLAHLSEENNTPQLCYNTMCDYLNGVGVVPNVNIKIEIAKPNGLGPIFVIN